MSHIVQTFDEKNNFWKLHPQLKTLMEFLIIWNIDKGKEKSSKIMWAICFYMEPASAGNSYGNIPEGERKERLKTDFLKDKSFSWEKEEIKDAVELYRKTLLTTAQQSLRIWEETMNKRDKVLKEFYQEAADERDIDTIVTLDKALANTPKFFADYQKIVKSIEVEESEQKTGKAGKPLSESDSDEL